MIGDYANQSLTLKKVTATSEYNEKTYTTSTIKGRKETGFRLIRNQFGQETISSATVFTATLVNVDDLIDDKLVIASIPQVGLGGTVQYYEVYLI